MKKSSNNTIKQIAYIQNGQLRLSGSLLGDTKITEIHLFDTNDIRLLFLCTFSNIQNRTTLLPLDLLNFSRSNGIIQFSCTYVKMRISREQQNRKFRMQIYFNNVVRQLTTPQPAYYSIKIENNKISGSGVSHLSKAQWVTIRQIDLTLNHIGAEGLQTLTKANWHCLSTIIIVQCGLTSSDMLNLLLIEIKLSQIQLLGNRYEADKRQIAKALKRKFPKCNLNKNY